MTKNIVAEPFPPGEFIQDELEARNWKQVDLAKIMGVTNKVVNQLVQNKIRVTTKRAQQLAVAFSSKPEEWLKLQMLYDLAISQLPPDEKGERKSRLWRLAPVSDMMKRGWLSETENIDFLEAQVKQFFGNKDVSTSTPVPFAARKSTDGTELTKEQKTWFQRSFHLAKSMHIDTAYSRGQTTWNSLFEDLSNLLCEPEEIRHVPNVLMKYGIRFLVVEHLPGSKIDGISFWLNKRAPVVVLSLRYNRIDWFWFTLCHELAHIYYGDGKVGEVNLDIELVGRGAQATKDKNNEEQRADEFAGNFLVDPSSLEDFCLRKRRIMSNADIVNFARRIEVHPGIVVGQLQHKNKISWSQGREMLVKIRNFITETALTDGWGQILTI